MAVDLDRRGAGTPVGPARLAAFLTATHRGERDPILTPERLVTLADEGQAPFVMLGDLSNVSRRPGAEVARRSVDDWVRGRGTPVDPALWSGTDGRRGAMRLCDLRPEPGVASPPAADRGSRPVVHGWPRSL